MEEYKSKIKSEIESLYEEGVVESSIIFDLEGVYYLNIKSETGYFINEKENLYKNILFELAINKKLRDENINLPVYIKEYDSPDLIKSVNGDEVIVYEATGEIIEIEKKDILFKNFNIISNYFKSKTFNKEEAYSLLLSDSFKWEYKRITKEKTKYIKIK